MRNVDSLCDKNCAQVSRQIQYVVTKYLVQHKVQVSGIITRDYYTLFYLLIRRILLTANLLLMMKTPSQTVWL